MAARTLRRPMRWAIAAHATRPAPLNSANTPTAAAAPAGVRPPTSTAAPAMTETNEIPATTASVRIAVSRYHCGIRSASAGVKPSSASPVVAAFGGLASRAAPASPATRYTSPRVRKATTGVSGSAR